MILGWVVDGGEVGKKGIKRRGLGKGLGYWGALRAGWEFLGTFLYLVERNLAEPSLRSGC